MWFYWFMCSIKKISYHSFFGNYFIRSILYVSLLLSSNIQNAWNTILRSFSSFNCFLTISYFFCNWTCMKLYNWIINNKDDFQYKWLKNNDFTNIGNIPLEFSRLPAKFGSSLNNPKRHRTSLAHRISSRLRLVSRRSCQRVEWLANIQTTSSCAHPWSWSNGPTIKLKNEDQKVVDENWLDGFEASN